MKEFIDKTNFDDNVFSYGLEREGFRQYGVQGKIRELQMDRFVSFYGISHLTCSVILVALKKSREEAGEDSSLLYFLVTLAWLKTYVTEPILAGIFQLTENTVRKWIWAYARSLQWLKPSKISIDLDTEVPQVFLYSVDGTHCRVMEPCTDPDKLWYSHKYNKPGVSYEIALHLYTNKVAWINGPFKAGESDLGIFRKEGGLKSKLPPGKLVIADKGYPSEDQISIPNTFDGDAVKVFKQRARARQESFNMRLKEFKILSNCFRSNLKSHGIVFEAVCVIVQFSIKCDRPLAEM